MKQLKTLLACLLCLSLLIGCSAIAATAQATDSPDGIRWFPVPENRRNDDAWEVECDKYGAICQRFTDTVQTTGNANFLDTVYGDDGSLTITRNGNDLTDGVYWPRIRTITIETIPAFDMKTADTLYFDFDVAKGTTWNIMLSINGMNIKLSKAICEAVGIHNVANSDFDGPAGSFKGSLNIYETLDDLAAEGYTESAVNAQALKNMKKTFVPQLTVFCVGAVGASLTLNEMFMSTADDVRGDACSFVDMGLLTTLGEEYYDSLMPDEPVYPIEPDTPDEPADPDAINGIRWFPVPDNRRNDDVWEVECDKEGCLCQRFNETPEDTGHANFLDTVYGDDGSLTITRNGNDLTDGVYWPRIRTIGLEPTPAFNMKTADTLYFDFEVARGTTWNIMLSFHGLTVKLSKVISDAVGIAGVESSDFDGGAGTFKGSLNIYEALKAIAAENSTESAVNAMAIPHIKNLGVPQLTVFCTGEVGASITLNELYMSTADDVRGDACSFVDMGLLTGLGNAYYGEEPVVSAGDINGDGQITLSDAMQVFYHVNEKITLTDAALVAADYDSNGHVTLADAMKVFYIVNERI